MTVQQKNSICVAGCWEALKIMENNDTLQHDLSIARNDLLRCYRDSILDVIMYIDTRQIEENYELYIKLWDEHVSKKFCFEPGEIFDFDLLQACAHQNYLTSHENFDLDIGFDRIRVNHWFNKASKLKESIIQKALKMKGTIIGEKMGMFSEIMFS